MAKKYYLVQGRKVKSSIILDSMKKYLSGTGKEVRQEYVEKNKVQLSDYNKEYQKKQRDFRKANHLCVVCGKKRSEIEVHLVCAACKKRAKKHLKSHRARKVYVNE